MTEEEWLSCTDHRFMLQYIRGSAIASERKLRLFACGCCRHFWSLLLDDRSRKAVETAEQFADGLASKEGLRIAYANAYDVAHELPDDEPYTWRSRPDEAAMFAASPVCSVGDDGFAYDAAWALVGGQSDEFVHKRRALSQLFRDLFGPLSFRPLRLLVPSVLAWRDGLVVQMATEAYEGRLLPSGTLDPERLAVLADGLVDAECDNAELVSHLRAVGPHLRGCWALDRVLAKE
jgi:hypothetical protein